jgi:hypothetical protein
VRGERCAGLAQTAPSMLGPWNHPTSHLIKCIFMSAVSTVKAPFVQGTSCLTVLIAPPAAPVFFPKWQEIICRGLFARRWPLTSVPYLRANSPRQMISCHLGKNTGAAGGAMRTVKHEVPCTNGAFTVETADMKMHLMR